MYTHAELKDGRILIHEEKTSGKSTSTFLASGIAISVTDRMITLGKAAPIALPGEIRLQEGDTLAFQLVDPEGALKKQVRTVTLGKCVDSLFKIAGHAKNPPQFKPEDGWSIKVRKFRAYLNHPGVTTDESLPQWISDSVTRQREYWNSLALLCSEARRKCNSDTGNDARRFIDEVVFPAVDAFNQAQGRGKKIKYSKALQNESASVRDLFGFKSKLLRAKEQGSSVPEGLAEMIEEFCSRYEVQYAPINEFLNHLPEIMKWEADQLKLTPWEIAVVNRRFLSALKRRRNTQPRLAFSSGWPELKFENIMRGWEIGLRTGKPGILATDVYKPEGIATLKMGPVVEPARSGHPLMKPNSRKSRRSLRPVSIRMPGKNQAPCTFIFCVLEHSRLPMNAHIKEWRFVYKIGKYWLNLTLEVRNPLPQKDAPAVGIDLGWRRTERGLRVAMAYDDQMQQFSEVLLDLESSPVTLGQRLRAAEQRQQLQVIFNRPESILSIVETKAQQKEKLKRQYILAI